MSRVKRNNVLLIDPLNDFDSINSIGLAFLRGFLESKKMKVCSINFNKIIDSKYESKYKKAIQDTLRQKNIYSSDDNFSGSYSLYFLLIRLYYFGPEIIWQAAEKIDVFKSIFSEYEKKLKEASHIGISITYSGQVLFALLLINFIKSKKINSKIIIGGSLVTSNIEDFIKLFSINPVIDFMVTGEGETPLLQILEGEEPQNIFNLYYFKNNKFEKSKNMCHHEEFNKLPSPIFDREDALLLQYSRTCYWGKCSFCIADKYHYNPRYVHRSANRLVEDIELNNLRIKEENKTYFFVDSALSKTFFIDFYDALKRKGDNGNKFIGYLRFDAWLREDILKLAREAGFMHFNCGVETTLDRLQKIIKKGYKIERIWRILDLYHKLNFKLTLMFMIGLPTQTKKELLQDLDAIKKMLERYPNIKKVEITPLSIKKDTDMYNNPKKYQIQVLDNASVFLGNHYPFKQLDKNAISVQEAIGIAENYIRDNLEDHKDKVFLWS